MRRMYDENEIKDIAAQAGGGGSGSGSKYYKHCVKITANLNYFDTSSNKGVTESTEIGRASCRERV